MPALRLVDFRNQEMIKTETVSIGITPFMRENILLEKSTIVSTIMLNPRIT